MEVEAPIEAIGDGAEVPLGVLAEGEGMVGPTEARFDVPQDRVHPMKERQVLGFAPADDSGLVRTAGVGNADETGQAIGNNGALRAQLGTGPVGDRFAREARQLIELDA